MPVMQILAVRACMRREHRSGDNSIAVAGQRGDRSRLSRVVQGFTGVPPVREEAADKQSQHYGGSRKRSLHRRPSG
jgi:hypothetical protein